MSFSAIFQAVTKTGRLFDSYNGQFYVPNKFLAVDFPDDTQRCKELMEEYLKDKPESARLEWAENLMQ